MESSSLLSIEIRLKSDGEIKNRQSCSPKATSSYALAEKCVCVPLLRPPPLCIPPSGFALALAGEDAKESRVRGLAEP